MRLVIAIAIIGFHFSSFGYGWVQKADFGGEARHRTTMLTIGNKIYAGLGHYNGAGVNVLFEDWWEYDPATNAWTQKANYAGGICYHAAGFTIGEYGYVGTGRISPIGSTYVNDFFRYDPTTNSWLQMADFPGAPIRGGVGFELNGYGFIGTGQANTGYTNTFYRYTPASNSWIQITSLPTGGRISAVAFTIGGYSYVGTGYDSSVGWSTADFYRYNSVLNTWEQMADVAGGVDPTPFPRMEASGFALDGKGYILTGDNISSGDNYNDMYEYDPLTDTWDSIPRFEGTSRRYLSSTTLNGVAYCGLGTNGTNFKDFWMFDRTLYQLEKDLENAEVIAYPNPTNADLHIKIEGIKSIDSENVYVDLFDLTGKRIASNNMVLGQTTFETTDFQNGAYFYHLRYKDQVLKSGKAFITK